MRNRDLVERFFDGYTSGRGSNLYIDGDKLVEYSTTLAQRVPGGYVLNLGKYSRTTSKIQTWIKYYCNNPVAILTDKTCNGLDFGVKNLTNFYTTETAEKYS